VFLEIIIFLVMVQLEPEHVLECIIDIHSQLITVFYFSLVNTERMYVRISYCTVRTLIVTP